MKKICLFILILLVFNIGGFGQVTVTNPTNTTPNLAATYTSLANAITALSGITAISGPVTITLAAGNPQTAPAGGYVIQFAATTTPANNITISGGANIITAFTPQATGNLNDAIFKIIGADNITIGQFVMQENPGNTTTTAASNNMTEWGVALLHASVTDGAQNNSIRNNSISLNRTYQNTFGVYSNGRHSATAVTTAENITSAAGANSGNKVFTNSISNTAYGVVFIGSNNASFPDDGTEIGGATAGMGNTITNWGGGATAASGYVSVTGSSFCIQANQQVNDNISYNTITSATVSGATFTFGAILKNYSVAAPTGTFTSTINNNTITLTSANASGTMNPILSQNITAAAAATLSISNNLIVNCALTAVGTISPFTGINNQSVGTTLNITNNIIRGFTSTSVTGGYTGITNAAAVITTINITNNKLGDAIAGAATFPQAFTNQINVITNSGAASTATLNITNNSIDGFSIVTSGQIAFRLNNSGAGTANINNNLLGSTTGSLISFSGTESASTFGIYTQGTPAGGTTSIQNNDIKGIVHSVTGTGGIFLLTNTSPVLSQTISNNTFTNLNLNTTGFIFLIQQNGAMASGASFTCNNNSIVTAFSKPASGGQVEFLHSTAACATGSTVTETGNNFSNVTLTGTTPLFGWNESSGASAVAGPTKTITGNTFNNITMGTGLAAVVYIWKGTTVNCSSNTISNISGPAVIWGIVNETTGTAGDFTFSSNNIFNLSSTIGDVGGIIGGTAVTSVNINNNTINNLTSTGASANIAGIDASATAATINNNTIHTLSGSGATAPVAGGIFVKGGGTVNVYQNKVYNILQSGAVSASSTPVNGLFFSGATAVTAYNNFISDLKVTNASLTDAIRGISVFSSTASSSYNIYHNSIYVNASSAGTDFGTSGIYHVANATATTAALNMIDNIIVNTSTANGTGVTAAYRRSGTALNNFAATSDNNLFYAGIPAVSRLIFYDGTNSDQTLAAYQTRVSARDANSISLMPAFVSATDLHLTTVNCRIDGRGTPVAAVTTDIDGAARNATTPDIGADEFTAASITTLAGAAGVPVCEDRIISLTGTTYKNNDCELIARVTPSGADPVAGKVNVCVTLDATQQTFNGEPYVQRHFDIEPTTSNETTTSATITLYFTDGEFALYNTTNPVWPPMPTVASGGNASPYISNVKVTQFHGVASTTPSSPGNYPGTRLLLTPLTVFYNGTHWEVSFDVAGFSGFYVHSNNYNAPLPITVNYLNGHKQGSSHVLDWKVTCVSTPRATMTLERSSDGRNFTGMYTIAADAARCAQPFDHTDVYPLKGMNYYRLKIVDADGKLTYSTTVALLNAVKGIDIISIAPNPVVNNHFKLNLASAQAGKMELVIFDMQGRLVNRQSLSLIAGFNSLPVNVSNLASGTYSIYGITGNDRSRTMRFVKQ